MLLVFNDPKGIPLIREAGTTVYAIPRDGVLRIRDRKPEDTRWRKLGYFYVDATGKRTEVSSSAKLSEHGVFGESSGMQVVEAGGTRSAVTYQTYLVGIADERRDWETLEHAISRAMVTGGGAIAPGEPKE